MDSGEDPAGEAGMAWRRRATVAGGLILVVLAVATFWARAPDGSLPPVWVLVLGGLVWCACFGLVAGTGPGAVGNRDDVAAGVAAATMGVSVPAFFVAGGLLGLPAPIGALVLVAAAAGVGGLAAGPLLGGTRSALRRGAYWSGVQHTAAILVLFVPVALSYHVATLIIVIPAAVATGALAIGAGLLASFLGRSTGPPSRADAAAMAGLALGAAAVVAVAIMGPAWAAVLALGLLAVAAAALFVAHRQRSRRAQ